MRIKLNKLDKFLKDIERWNQEYFGCDYDNSGFIDYYTINTLGNKDIVKKTISRGGCVYCNMTTSINPNSNDNSIEYISGCECFFTNCSEDLDGKYINFGVLIKKSDNDDIEVSIAQYKISNVTPLSPYGESNIIRLSDINEYSSYTKILLEYIGQYIE